MLEYTLKHRAGKVQCDVHKSVSQVWMDYDLANKVHGNKIKTCIILVDQEGYDHPDNAGKFFLYRIIKQGR